MDSDHIFEIKLLMDQHGLNDEYYWPATPSPSAAWTVSLDYLLYSYTTCFVTSNSGYNGDVALDNINVFSSSSANYLDNRCCKWNICWSATNTEDITVTNNANITHLGITYYIEKADEMVAVGDVVSVTNSPIIYANYHLTHLFLALEKLDKSKILLFLELILQVILIFQLQQAMKFLLALDLDLLNVVLPQTAEMLFLLVFMFVCPQQL